MRFDYPESETIQKRVKEIEGSHDQLEMLFEFWVEKFEEIEREPHDDVVRDDAYHAMRQYILYQVERMGRQLEQARELLAETVAMQS